MVYDLNNACALSKQTRSKLIRIGIQMAIDSVVNTVPTTASPPTASLGDTSSDEIASLRRGDTTWFEMAGVCNVLGIQTEALLSEIDIDDDILKYLGKDWIDTTGVGEARSLCRDHKVSDSFWAWAQTKINSTT